MLGGEYLYNAAPEVIDFIYIVGVENLVRLFTEAPGAISKGAMWIGDKVSDAVNSVKNKLSGSGSGNPDPDKDPKDFIKAGKNFKDHFIRHKHLLEKVTGNKYGSYKNPEPFLSDIAKVINDGTVKYVGQGTLNKASEVMNIYRGSGITIVTKLNGEWVTILEQGKGMDLNIIFK